MYVQTIDSNLRFGKHDMANIYCKKCKKLVKNMHEKFAHYSFTYYLSMNLW